MDVIRNIMKKSIDGTPDIDGLIDFNYHEYPLKLDKKKGLLYAVKDDSVVELIGELEDYTVKKPKSEEIVEKKVVSPFLVKKLMMKYLFLKRLSGYHISSTSVLEKGSLVRFTIEEGGVTKPGVGLISSVRDKECTVQVVNKNINFMDDSSPIDMLDVPIIDITPVSSIREEIKHLENLYSKDLVYNYELYYRYVRVMVVIQKYHYQAELNHNY